MKNMKRALSLVLTMAMLLGMFLVPTSAANTFADADLIQNTEAVTITSGIGLFAGTSDGNFAPKAAVTRAQMATIIVKMLRGSDFNADAFKGVDKFPDTASFEGGWAEGYINACVQLGVVSGYGDGTFKPGNTLTTAEALTMVINALGVDPGPGEWPLTYMAKAEAMKLYGDLKVKPATNAPLTRDQLAVIVWEGLQYSPEGKSGYKIPGSDLIFTDIADAVLANGNNFEGITEAVGQDSLASKVYEIKTATGWVTGNAATGESCTVLTSASGVETNYAIETGVDMLGHYATIYYKEQYKNDEEPGLVYSIVDESTVVTVKEVIDSAKEYKAAFGKSINEAQNGFVFDDSYVADALLNNDMNVPGYTAGTNAPKGTYIIADGVIVAYIEPAAVHAGYISSINNADGNEQIFISGVAVSNAEGDDCVVEYEGMKTGDYVTYVVVNGIYVLSPVEKVSGAITKTSTTELNGENYDTITLGGTEYRALEPQGTSPSNNHVGAKLNNDLSRVIYGQQYTLYTTADGHYIGFETADGGVNVDDTVFLLGSFVVKEKDQYGKTAYFNKARGVDIEGKEVMIVIGKADEVNNETGYQEGEDTEALGTMYTVSKGFYTVKDSTVKEEKKEGVQVLATYQEAATAENPVYTSRTYIAQTNWTGSSSIVVANGTHAFNKTSSKFIILDGDLRDSAPLAATVHTGTMSPGVDLEYGENSGYLLLTLNKAQSDIEVFVQIVAEEVLETKYVYATQEQVDTASRVAEGYAYKVYDLSNGSEIEVILDKDATQITQPGYVKLSVLEDDLYTADASSMNVDLVDVITDSSKNQASDDITVFISDVAFIGLTGARMRFQRAAGSEGKAIDGYDNVSYNNSNATSAKVVDLRTEDEIQAAGLGEITSMTQIDELVANDPGIVVVMDIGMKGHYRSHTLNNVFVKRVERNTVGINTVVWLGEDAFSSDRNGDFANGMIVSSKINSMGEEVKVYVDEVMDKGAGFYRYMVDADGDIKLIPFDNANVGSVFGGNFGMIGQHEEISSIESVDGKLLMNTINQSHSCGFDCTNASFEARKDVYITADTKIYDATNGRWIDGETIAPLLNDNLVTVDYYCAGAIKAASSQTDRLTEKDDTAELVILTGVEEYPHSCDGNHEGWTALDAAKTITESGNYYLTADISGKIIVSSGVTMKLCMCGHSITSAGVALDISGNVELINCVGKTGGNITSTATGSQTVQLNGTGTLTMKDGVHMVNSVNRAVMLILNGGHFIMEGGDISNNNSRDYGAIWVNGGGKFTMNGGTISGNKAMGTGSLGNTGNGGAVYLAGANAIFTMNDGVISGNSAKQGGGVFVANGTFTMNGGTIVSNKATTTTQWSQGGAGVHVAAAGTFNLTGGSVTANAASAHGGGVFAYGKVNMSGGSITGNTATNSNGSGVMIRATGAKFTMTGGTVSGAGNLIYTINTAATVEASGGTITNTAGGIVFFTNDATNVVKLSGDVVVNGVLNTYKKEPYQVTGGTYSLDPSAVLKDGYKATLTGGKYVVTAE